jgi:hypothetical protein
LRPNRRATPEMSAPAQFDPVPEFLPLDLPQAFPD